MSLAKNYCGVESQARCANANVSPQNKDIKKIKPLKEISVQVHM